MQNVSLKSLQEDAADDISTVCLYAKCKSILFAYMQNVSLKSLQEDAADDII